MPQIIDAVISVAVEIIVVFVGALGIALLHKAKSYVDNLKKKDQLGIIDLVTDRVVEYAEAELKGKAGIEKRDFAVEKAIAILASKGIVVEKDEIIAGIENGVTKLKHQQMFLGENITTIDGLSSR
jgi:Bacteriophage holin of superfamily 6 (Holin_LLH)